VLTGILRHPAVAQEVDEQVVVADGPSFLAEYVNQDRPRGSVQHLLFSEASATGRIKDEGILHEQIMVGKSGGSVRRTELVSGP
jgi:hypothetical protein